MTKGPDAFRTISEAALEVGVAQHVLRFWETKFSFSRPMKRAGGRRFYRPHDLQILRGVRRLLHDEGYTIMGVQRLHRDQGVARLLVTNSGEKSFRDADLNTLGYDAGTPRDLRGALAGAIDILESAKARLDGALISRVE